MRSSEERRTSLPDELWVAWMSMLAQAAIHVRMDRSVLIGLAAAATALTCLFILVVGALLHHSEAEPAALLTPLFSQRRVGSLAALTARHRLLRPGGGDPPSPPLPPSSAVRVAAAQPPFQASTRRAAEDESDWLAPLKEAAFLLLCYNRPKYLNETLTSLLSVEGAVAIPVYVSQDGDHAPTAAVARWFNVTHWQRPRVALLSPRQQGQAWLAQHYRWALDRVLLERNHSHAILLEDDMVFSPDFVRFFAQTAWLLDADPTLWCVSSWNDNGFESLVQPADASRLFRTDFFPGLGWMLRRQLWRDELSPRFPLEHWDHWMRLQSTSKGRDCAAPLVSRNFNIGVSGANMESAQYAKYLKHMRYNTDPAVRLVETERLLHEPYEAAMAELVQRAARQPLPSSRSPRSVVGTGGTYLYTYTAETYAQLAGHFGVWTVPRALHRHTAVLTWQGNAFVLASARHSPYLPDELREQRPAQLALLTGAAGEACTDVCARGNRSGGGGGGGGGLACEPLAFEWANDVDQLAARFPCERGFATVTGPDIPNYVVQEGNEYYRRCLVSEGGWTCEAKHPATRRLCPCMPTAGRGAARSGGGGGGLPRIKRGRRASAK